jgi:hypothetical protein
MPKKNKKKENEVSNSSVKPNSPKKEPAKNMAGSSSIIRDESGRPSGVISPSGKEIIGRTPEQVRALLEGFNSRVGSGTTLEATDVGNLQQEAEKRGVSTEAFLAELQRQEQGLEPSQFQKQFESEGGYQEFETRADRLKERAGQALDIGATIGLQPARLTAEGIRQGFKSITGKEMPELMKTADLVDTPFGKALGLTTLGLGSVMLGASVGVVAASAASTATAYLASSLGISKGLLIAGGLTGAGLLSGLKPSDIPDLILNRENLNEVKAGLEKYSSTGTDIAAIYAGTSLQTKMEGLAKLNQLEESINIIEHKGQQAVILDPSMKTKSEYSNDFIPELEDAKNAIHDAREALLSDAEELTPEEKAFFLNRIKEREKEQREELKTKGFIKETIP